jgi:hypothetical protein
LVEELVSLIEDDVLEESSATVEDVFVDAPDWVDTVAGLVEELPSLTEDVALDEDPAAGAVEVAFVDAPD